MIIELAPQDIAKSPSNPRKRGLFDGIDDLTESVRAKGLLQPVVVRAKGKGHELVFGHRRREAAIRAELATIPCIVREFSDDEVLEVQLMENLEREDVHPLDEAEGFAELVKRGRTVQQIAEKVGRPAAFVAQRMKLLDLGEDGRKALDRGSISLAVAMVLARVPAKLQADALGEIEESGDWDYQAGGRSQPTAQEALKIVKERFVLRLALAKFPTDDAALVKAAGACTTCPKRSGNQGVLFADFEDEDLCLDPVCHRKKADAYFARLEKAKPEKYSALLSGPDAKTAIEKAGYQGGKYVKLDGDVAFEWDRFQSKAVKKIIGKAELPITLAQDPRSGEHIELVRREDVAKLSKGKRKELLDHGERETAASQSSFEAERRRNDMKQKAVNTAVRLALGAIVENAAKVVKPEQALRLIVMALAQKAWSEDQRAVLERRGLMPSGEKSNYSNKVETALVGLAKSLPDAEVAGLGLELAAVIAAPDGSPYYRKPKPELDIWDQLLGAAGVDFAALQKVELDALKAKAKEKTDKAKAKAKREAEKAAKAPAAAAPATAKKPTKAKPAKRARKAGAA